MTKQEKVGYVTTAINILCTACLTFLMYSFAKGDSKEARFNAKLESKADIVYVDKQNDEIKTFIKNQNDKQDENIDKKLDIIIEYIKSTKSDK